MGVKLIFILYLTFTWLQSMSETAKTSLQAAKLSRSCHPKITRADK